MNAQRLEAGDDVKSPPADTERGTASRSPSSARRIIPLVVIGLLFGVLAGRFLLASGDGGNASAPPPQAATLEERVAATERKVEANPNDVQSWQQLGGLYIQRALETGDPAFYDLSERAIDRAEELAPDDPANTVTRGALELALHRFRDALDLGEQALEQLPRNVSALGVTVDANVEVGNYSAAAERLQEMLDARPGLAALTRTSYLRELNGDYDGAIQAMQQAVTAGAGAAFDVAVTQTLLGDLYAHHGDIERGAAAYDAALDRVPELPAAIVGRARITAIEGDIPAAIDELTTLSQRVPLQAAVLLLSDLQAYQATQGEGDGDADTNEIIRALAALQVASGQVVDLEMALFEGDLGNGTESLELARAAYDDRKTIYAAQALAWALLQTGDAQAALPYVDEALKLGTIDALVRFRMSAVLAAAERPDQAREQLQIAFDLDPWFSWRLRDQARSLAQDLDVPVPAQWDSP